MDKIPADIEAISATKSNCRRANMRKIQCLKKTDP